MAFNLEKTTPIPKEFETLDLYWKASNYLAVAQVRWNLSENGVESCDADANADD